MKRLSAIVLGLSLVLVCLFLAYKFHMANQFNKILNDSKALSNQSLTLTKSKRHQISDRDVYLFSPSHHYASLHQDMLEWSSIYVEEIKPLAKNEFGIVVPEVQETGLEGVQKILVHYRSYKKGPISFNQTEEKIIRSYHIKQDKTLFTLDDLVQNYGARVDEEITKTLQDQAVSNVDEVLASLKINDSIESFKKNSVFSDGIDYREDSLLLHSYELKTPIKVPYRSIFDVIDSRYLKADSLEAYKAFEAEEKARKEAEEAARIEAERQRQLSAFDYGPVLQGERVVALTFDDGPNPSTTPQVLDILSRYGAKATFYILGSAIDGNSAILNRMVNDGHELGNHTWSHPKLTGLSADQVAWQFNSTNDAIKAATGVVPKTFRPPYGATNAFVKSQTNMVQMLWTVDTLDWKNRSTEAIMANIRAQLQPGGVILMHDIHPTTMNALPTVMDYLVAEGYRFVTVSELYGL